MFKQHSSCVLLLALACSGCVSHYQPVKSDRAATFTLVRGATELGAKSLQEYEAYRDASCTKAPGTGRLAALLTYGSQTKTAKIEPEKPIYLLAKTSLFGTAPRRDGDDINVRFYLTTDSCMNLVRFTPNPSGTYEVQQEASSSGCTLTVLDSSTSRAPSDLVIEDARSCAAPAPKS